MMKIKEITLPLPNGPPGTFMAVFKTESVDERKHAILSF
jgi:hypothetical protein